MVLLCRLSILAGLVFCILLSADVFAQDTRIARRAAFDIGSAAIKCTVADVNVSTGQIVNIVEEYTKKIDFVDDLARSPDGNISREIMDKGIEAIKEMRQAAIKVRAQEFSGAVGASFHLARNGRVYLTRIKEEAGLPCRIISKEQAAMLGYHAVCQKLGMASPDLLVWDIGGGIMHMTVRNASGGLSFLIDPMGSVSFKNQVIRMIQGKDVNVVTSPNPISASQVKKALDYIQSHANLNIPQSLMARIRVSNMKTVGIGGVHYYSIPETLGGRNKVYTREEVKTALKKWTGKPDKAFNSEYAATRLTNLILILGYMNALGLEAITPLKINEADGLLSAPEFW